MFAPLYRASLDRYPHFPGYRTPSSESIKTQTRSQTEPDSASQLCRQLSMERCEGLCRCELANSALQNLSLADCPNLHTLCLLCPSLQTLNLEECKLLSQVSSLAARASESPLHNLSLLVPHVCSARNQYGTATLALDACSAALLHSPVLGIYPVRLPSLHDKLQTTGGLPIPYTASDAMPCFGPCCRCWFSLVFAVPS